MAMIRSEVNAAPVAPGQTQEQLYTLLRNEMIAILDQQQKNNEKISLTNAQKQRFFQCKGLRKLYQLRIEKQKIQQTMEAEKRKFEDRLADLAIQRRDAMFKLEMAKIIPDAAARQRRRAEILDSADLGTSVPRKDFKNLRGQLQTYLDEQVKDDTPLKLTEYEKSIYLEDDRELKHLFETRVKQQNLQIQGAKQMMDVNTAHETTAEAYRILNLKGAAQRKALDKVLAGRAARETLEEESKVLAQFVGDGAKSEYIDVTQHMFLLQRFDQKYKGLYETMYANWVREDLSNQAKIAIAVSGWHMTILERVFADLSALFRSRYWAKHDANLPIARRDTSGGDAFAGAAPPSDYDLVMDENPIAMDSIDIVMRKFLAQEMVDATVVEHMETEVDTFEIPAHANIELKIRYASDRFMLMFPMEIKDVANTAKQESRDMVENYFSNMLSLYWVMITRNPSFEVRFPHIGDTFDEAWMERAIDSETTRCIHSNCSCFDVS